MGGSERRHTPSEETQPLTVTLAFPPPAAGESETVIGANIVPKPHTTAACGAR